MCIKPNHNIIFYEEKDESMLINLVDNYFIGLDEMSTVIWKMVTRGLDEMEIINSISKEYNVGEEIVTEDVQELFDELEEKGAIQR